MGFVLQVDLVFMLFLFASPETRPDSTNNQMSVWPTAGDGADPRGQETQPQIFRGSELYCEMSVSCWSLNSHHVIPRKSTTRKCRFECVELNVWVEYVEYVGCL